MSRNPKAPHPSGAVPSWALQDSVRHDGGPKPVKLASHRAVLLRVDEAADCLNVSAKTIRRMIGASVLKAVRIGRLVRIPASEIERIVGATSNVSDTPNHNARKNGHG